jgi:hypothetical protein
LTKTATSKKANTSRVVRISAENYVAFTKLKTYYAMANKRAKVTYDEFLAELIKIAVALSEGDELYRVGERVFTDIADARGEAIMYALRLGKPPTMPEVLISLGPDNEFSTEKK